MLSIFLFIYPSQEESTEPPAIVIYMVDPLSFVTDNPDLVRLSSLALLRCFHALVPKIKSESIRESVHLQVTCLVLSNTQHIKGQLYEVHLNLNLLNCIFFSVQQFKLHLKDICIFERISIFYPIVSKILRLKNHVMQSNFSNALHATIPLFLMGST